MDANAAGQQLSDSATAGPIARPIRLFPAALLLGFGLDHMLPLPFPVPGIGLVHWVSAIIAGFLILVGIGLFAAGVRDFSHASTPLPTNKPARALVTTGIYGWTRNPIYLGFFLMHAGIGAMVRSPWILILIMPIAVAMRYGVVAREEAYLERRFGGVYRDYRRRVPRWL